MGSLLLFVRGFCGFRGRGKVRRLLTEFSPLHLPHEGECSDLVLGLVRLVRPVGEPKLRKQKSNKSLKNPAASGSRALPLMGEMEGASPLSCRGSPLFHIIFLTSRQTLKSCNTSS